MKIHLIYDRCTICWKCIKNTTSIKSVKIEDDENDWDEDENLDESKTVQKTNKMNSDNPVTMSNQTSPEDGKIKRTR